MDKLHIFGPQFSTFVRTVMLCCEEKGIAYTQGMEESGQEIAFKSEQHFAWHPYGKVPVLLVNGSPLFETGAICRYLDSVYDGLELLPGDAWERALVDQASSEIALYHYDALIRDLVLEFYFPKGENGQVDMTAVDAALPAAKASIARLTTMLGEQSFIAGAHYTLADAMLLPILDYVAALPVADQLLAGADSLNAYLERMRERDSSKRVLSANS
ncbi:glutathione S-transferase family protein [Marinobacterium lutimaris]|uniref:glutathione transferase n=1 Tax=Marinobacterium lutimaris TaxID=568106 RepID=A0A1H5X2L7_9GAMM|nr:glutathione S-transferase family protein [Marinobacterium lutimaris]SEG05610.1 glutathione S-transferase [Marinobacterium lutimaris]